MPPKPPIPLLRLAQLPPAFLAPSLNAPKTSQWQQTRGIRTVMKRRFHPKLIRLSRFNNLPSLPTLQTSRKDALKRKSQTTPRRTGVLAVKKGMTAVFDPVTGVRTPCTVLQLDRVQVVGHKTEREHGYYAVQVGYGWRHPDNVGRPLLGHWAGQRVPPKEKVVEFKVRDQSGLVAVGLELKASWFVEGNFVDAKSNTKGFGFTGGMVKHGWKGQPASHGNSLAHRIMGSAGGGQGSGSRVAPGKNMAGRMGNEQNTIRNLKVLKVDEANGIVLVGGPVSGPKGAYVKIQDAIKKPWPDLPGNRHPGAPEPVARQSATKQVASAS